MTFTDLVIILFILALLAYAIYDQFIMPRRNGPVLLAIPLLRRSRVDGMIFVGLTAILIYNNITQHGTAITTWLLSALALMGLYLFWIRTPKIATYSCKRSSEKRSVGNEMLSPAMTTPKRSNTGTPMQRSPSSCSSLSSP